MESVRSIDVNEGKQFVNGDNIFNQLFNFQNRS